MRACGVGHVLRNHDGRNDLSVGSVAALGSVAAALASPVGPAAGLAAGIGAGLAAGLINAVLVTRLKLMPFIATLATGRPGVRLLLAGNQTVGAYEVVRVIGQGKLGIFPIPALIAVVAYLLGSLMLNLTSTGSHGARHRRRRRCIAAHGSACRPGEIHRLSASGELHLAGVILAAQAGAGQPLEGVGWELSPSLRWLWAARF